MHHILLILLTVLSQHGVLAFYALERLEIEENLI